MSLHFQTWIVLLLVGLATGFLLRNLLKGLPGKDCASGCGACPSNSCALRRLEERLRSEG